MRPRFLAVAFAALASAGCQDGPKIVVPPPASTSGAVHADLPCPPGFVYSENLSDSNPTGAFRVIMQQIKGPNQRVEASAKFFKTVYPGQGWSLESEDTQQLGVVRLAFTKKNERCRVEIKDETPTSVLIVLKVTRKD